MLIKVKFDIVSICRFNLEVKQHNYFFSRNLSKADVQIFIVCIILPFQHVIPETIQILHPLIFVEIL